jgi:hypothetical protein
MKSKKILFLALIGLIALWLVLSFSDPGPAWLSHPNETPSSTQGSSLERSSAVPDLPFPDNPDPDQCGIPIEWGSDNQAWLSGLYEGELIEPTVHLYDSHLRLEVTAEAPHGAEVEVLLYQQNPVLDYYLVNIQGQSGQGSQGWVPAPFLSFEPVQDQ